MAHVEPFLRAAWEEISASGGHSPLAVLLPRELRGQVGLLDDCPLQYMSGRLRDCEDALSEPECRCQICSNSVAPDAVALPGGCAATRARLLMRIVGGLAVEFDPDLYTPGAGDLGAIVAARLSAARRRRKEQRERARSVVRAAWAARHVVAAKRRCLRIEGLRTSMGEAAFAQMVQDDLERRRNKIADGAVPADALLQQTRRWWRSAEGRPYHGGPPPPDRRLVAPVRRWGAAIGSEGLDAPLLAAGPAVFFSVPLRCVARFACWAADWSMSRSGLVNRCLCSAVVKVDFDAGGGQRVPRVHVAAGRGNERLALLDDASLENLRPGDVVADPRRLLAAGGRVVALTGEEPVALALPRPYDQFDVVLRGPTPPTSVLPVGWDITDVAGKIMLEIVWAAAPATPLTLVVVASEDDAWADGDERAAFARLEQELARHYGIAAGRVEAVEAALLWPWRALAGALRRLDRAAMRCLRRAWAILGDVAAPTWRGMRRACAVGAEALAPIMRRTYTAIADVVAAAWEALAPARRHIYTAVVDVAAAAWEALAPAGRVLRSQAERAVRRISSVASGVGGAARDALLQALRTLRRHAAAAADDARAWRATAVASRAARAAADGAARGARAALTAVGDVLGAASRAARHAIEVLGRIAGDAWALGDSAVVAVSSLPPVRLAIDSCSAAWRAVTEALASAFARPRAAPPPVRLARVRAHDSRQQLQRMPH